MKRIIIAAFIVLASACSTAPTMQSVHTDLLKVQSDLAIIAADSQPIIKTATTVADIAEVATGNPELVPITNAVSAAVQAANVAVAKTSAQ